MTNQETPLSMEECSTQLALWPGRSMVGYQEFVMHDLKGVHGDAPLIIFQIRSDLNHQNVSKYVEDELKGVVRYLLTKKLEMVDGLQLVKNEMNLVK